MRSCATVVLLSCLWGFTKAAPATRAFTGCDVSNDVIPLPAGQTTLTTLAGLKPVYIAVGFGTQNYSCSAAGTYTSIGAVAELIDASCAYNVLEPILNKGGNAAVAVAAAKAAFGSSPLVLGHHYFINNPTGAAGVSPVFDFRAGSQKGDPNAFVILSKTGDMPAPNNPTTNVDWLSLQKMTVAGQGDLATEVFRIYTVGGQPPTSCTPGSAPVSVAYAANYWFFK